MFPSTDKGCFLLEGERDRLVQTAQEHGPADDVQREDRP